MTQKTFNILEFCTTCLRSSDFGIFENRFIGNLVDDIPEDKNMLFSGMWVYVIASVNMIAANWGYVADKVIVIDTHRFVYLYRLE